MDAAEIGDYVSEGVKQLFFFLPSHILFHYAAG